VRRDLDRLQDILEAIDRIQQQTKLDRESFDADALVQVWVIHHLEVVGEACRGLSDELRSRHPEVPWSADWLCVAHAGPGRAMHSGLLRRSPC
jgi:uncharacterized protein with HEPN domain